MKIILDYTKEEMEEFLKPKFRIKQLYQWIYQRYATDYKVMHTLPKDMRNELENNYTLMPLTVVNEQKASDGTIKYLFKLSDNTTVESVLLPMKEEEVDEDGKRVKQARYSICISSQVGCKIGCSFCLTAKGGFVRNLSAGEIVAQVLLIKQLNNFEASKRVNIVYMGMGEPLDNLPNVAKAVKIFSDIDGLSISPKRQTISTSGLSSQIKKLGSLNLGVLLAISLHAVDDKLREELMPINKAYNINSIINAVREFPIDIRKRVMFEYLVMRDVNDDIQSAKKLVSLLHGIKAKVNLIYFNPHEGAAYERPSEKKVKEFLKYLNNHGIICTIRQSKGLDVSAACGQLRERSKNDTA